MKYGRWFRLNRSAIFYWNLVFTTRPLSQRLFNLKLWRMLKRHDAEMRKLGYKGP